MGNDSIRAWHVANFPLDKVGYDINPNVTFMDLFRALDSRKDVYGVLGVDDSIVRENAFRRLAAVMGCNYDYIYEQWLLS